MQREEFETKLKEAGFENLNNFIEKTGLERTKIENYLRRDSFPPYFNFLFESLIKVNQNDLTKIKEKEDMKLRAELEKLVLERENLVNEFKMLMIEE